MNLFTAYNFCTATIGSVQTANPGTTWTALTAASCVAIELYNGTGTTLEYRRGGAGTGFQIPTGASRLIVGISNAEQISVRRVDTSNSQVTAYYETYNP